MPDFTKGTWRIEKVCSKEYSLDREIENIRGYAIYSDKSKYYIAGVRTLADAKLFAAAPDLYDALCAFLGYLKFLQDNAPNEHKNDFQDYINRLLSIAHRIDSKED